MNAAIPRIVQALPVASVTLYEDRGQVKRRGTAALSHGLNRLRIEGVSPTAVDRSLTARLHGPGQVRLIDVQIERERLTDPADSRRADAEIQQRLRDLGREQATVQDRIRGEEQRIRLIGEAIAATLADAVVDAAAGRDGQVAWQQALERLTHQEGEAIDRLNQAQADQRLLAETQRDLEARRPQARAQRPPLVAAVVVLVEASQAGTYDLEVGYLVPGACWRPQHRAVMDRDQVIFATEACVWQATGEDWSGVSLACSTERTSQAGAIPLLQPDRLRLQAKDKQGVVQIRESAVEDTGPSGSASGQDEVPGVDDGGQARTWSVPGTVDVPSDGRPHRYGLAAFTVPAASSLQVRAERIPAAILRTLHANRLAMPLLAGPVDLVRNGGPCGRTQIPFVAAGADFELSWGPDPAVRVERASRRDEQKAGMFSGWQVLRTTTSLDLSNLADTSRVLEITERVPVSEIETVQTEIETKLCTPAPVGDGDGLQRWTVELPPNAHRRVELVWHLRKKSEVQGLG